MSKQVEQLYFTWATAGFGDIPGFRLRAASQGVADINSARYSTLKPYLNYFLPKGTDPYIATTQTSPVCLVYAQAGEDYILAHKVFTGKDGYDRPGTYFVHMLVELPDDFVAEDALKMWHAQDFWQYWKVADDPGPELRYLSPLRLPAIKGAFNTAIDEQVSHLLYGLEDFLSRVIQAYLLLGATQKLFIAGTPEQVIALVWALTRSVPRKMQRDLTFSTYEQDVLKASVRVVGTCLPQTAQLKGYIMPPQLLPAECYRLGLVIDWDKRQVTGIQNATDDIVEYAKFVVGDLLKQAKGKEKELDNFLRDAENIEDVKDTQSLLDFFNEAKLYDDNNQTPLKEENVLTCFQFERLSKHLYKEKVFRYLIAYAMADPRWWNEQAKIVIQGIDLSDAMQEKLRALGKRIATALYMALIQQETEKWPVLQSILLTVSPPDRDNVPWIQLLIDLNKSLRQNDKLHPTDAFRWTTRFDLLTQWAVCYWTYYQEKEQRGDEGQDIRLWNQPVDEQLIFSWLELHSWDEFKAICDFIEKERKQKAKDNKKKAREQQAQEYDVFPHKWLQLAFINLLMHSDEQVIPNWLPAVFDPQAHYTYLMGALIHMMQFPKQQPAVLLCFSKLAKRHYSHIPLVLAMLISAGSLSHKLEEQFFAVAGLNSQQKNELLENYLIHILPDNLTPAVPKVVDIVRDYLDKLTLERLNGEEFPVICETLKLLHNRQVKLPPEVTLQVKYWIRICHSIATFHPFFPSEKSSFELNSVSLTTLNDAIVGLSLPSKDKLFKSYKEELFFVLIQHITDDNTLRTVLKYLYPALTNESWQALFKDLVTYFGRSYTSHISKERFIPYINMALSTYRQQEPKSKADRKLFWSSYLQPLFGSIDSEIFAWINRVFSNESYEYEYEWKLFINQYKPYRKRFARAGEIVAGAKAVRGNVAHVTVAAVNFAGTAVHGLQGAIQTHLPGQSLKQGQTQPASSGQNDSGRQSIDQHVEQVEQSGVPGQQDQQFNIASGQGQSPVPGVHPQDPILNGGYNSELMKAQDFSAQAQKWQRDNVPDYQQNPLVRNATPPPQLLEQPNGQAISSSSASINPSHRSQPLTNSGSFSQDMGGHSEPVSIVNGSYSIPLERLQMVYALKDIYIRVRLDELEREHQKESSQGHDVTWIEDERYELLQCQTPEDILRMLENDELIKTWTNQFWDMKSHPELDPAQHLDYVMQQVQSHSNYVGTLGRYSNEDMGQVLLVFLRYRSLSYSFRQQGTVSIREWLERQRKQANFQRNEKLLKQQGIR